MERRFVSRRVLVDGLPIRYLETIGGEGTPLVIVSTTFLTARSYRGLASQFAARRWCSVLIVEPPGSGLSARGKAAWSPEDYARWLRSFVRTVGIHRCEVVGHSNSALPVLLAAADEPELFERVIVADPVGPQRSKALSRILAARFVDGLREWRLSMVLLPHALFNLALHPRNVIGQIVWSTKVDLPARLSDLRLPVVIAWGGRDSTIPLADAKRLRALLPNAEVRVRPEGSHDWLLTHPVAFARATLMKAAFESQPSHH